MKVTSAFALCMMYRDRINEVAEYYLKKVKFKFKYCATDYDSFVHYFGDMYFEGLVPILERTYSLLLPLGIFDVDFSMFVDMHSAKYNSAIIGYEKVANIEINHNNNANQVGGMVSNSINMQGGGFGIKGAVKGVAKAEAFNAGMGLLGAYVANQKKMTQEEKAKTWDTFDSEKFFALVYNDYTNVFYTLIQVLADKGLAGNSNIEVSKETETLFQNLHNPMFPENQFVENAVKIIERNPFVGKYYDLLEMKIGTTEELTKVKNYFCKEQMDK